MSSAIMCSAIVFAIAVNPDAAQAGGGFGISAAPAGIDQDWWDAQIAAQSGSQCQACHLNVFGSGASTVGGKAAASLNAYGLLTDLVLAGDVGISIASLPATSGDADGDGVSNGRELGFAPFTQPGFASSKPGAPSASNDGPISADSGVAKSIAISTLLGNDSIGDGLTLSLLSVQSPSNGSVSISGSNVVFTAAAAGAASFTYTVSDGLTGSETDTASVSLNVAAGNQAPSAVTLSNTVTSLLDNQSAQLKVADIAVTDDVLGTNTLGLTGTNAALFEIVGNELFLKAGQALTAGNTLQVAVTVDDVTVGATPDATSSTLSISIGASNQAPTAVTLSNAVTSVLDNQSAQLKVADIAVTDDGQGSNTLGLTGTNASLFEIVGNALFLKAGQALTAGNTLQVAVTVDDVTVGATPDATSSTLSISIGASNLAPTAVTLSNTQNSVSDTLTAQLKVADIAVTDDMQGTNTLGLTGTSAALFEIIGNELFLKAGQTLTAGNTLQVAVTVDDTTVGASPDATSTTLSISVTAGNQVPTAVTLSNTVTSVLDNQSAQFKVADIFVTDDGLGTNTLGLTGTNAAQFEIIGTALFLKAGQTLTAGNTLQVAVTVDDTAVGATPDATSTTLSISVNASNQVPTAVTLSNTVTSVLDNQSAQLKVADIAVTDDGLGSNTLGLTGTNASLFEIIGDEVFLKAGQTLTAGNTLQVAVTVDDTSVGGTPDATSSTLSISVGASNLAPTAVTLSNTVASVLDNQSAQLKVADIAVTDDGLGSNTLGLTGTNAALFEIVGNALFLKAGQTLTAGNTLQVAVTVDDVTVGSTPDATSSTLSISIGASNLAPTAVTLSNAVTSVFDDQAAQLKIADIAVTDDGQGSNTLGLSGTNAALFEIVGNALFLKAGQTLTVGNTLQVAVTVDDTSLGATPDATSTTLSISVAAGNRAPTAVNDSGTGFATDADTTFTTASVLTNDTDPENAALSVQSLNTTGTSGTVTSRGDGTFDYNPNGQFAQIVQGQSATDSFTYTVADPAGATSSATVTITINGTASPDPTVAPDSATTIAGRPVAIAVTDNDVGGAAIVSLELASAPTSGSVTIAGLSVTYTPDEGFEGQDSFTYIAVAASGRSEAATVTVTVNPPPSFTAGDIANATTDPTLLSTASALDDLCVTLGDQAALNADAAQMFLICQGLAEDGAGSSIDGALRAISVEEVFAASEASFQFADAINGNLFQRMKSLRTTNKARGVNLAGLGINELGGAMAPFQAVGLQAFGNYLSNLLAGPDASRWGVFVSGDLGFGSTSAGSSSGERKFDTLALSVGADYLFTDNFIGGLAVTFSSDNSKFAGNFGKHEIEGMAYSAYGSLDLGDAYVDSHVTYTDRTHNSTRAIAFATGGQTVDELALAKFGGNDLIGSVSVGVPFNIDQIGIDANIGVTYVDGSIDGYVEQGAGAFNMSVAKQEYDYFLTEIGARISYEVPSSESSSITPFVDIHYNLVSGRDEREIHAGFAIDPLGRRDVFLQSLTDSDSEYFNVGAGLVAQLQAARISAEYTTALGYSDLEFHRVMLTVSFALAR